MSRRGPNHHVDLIPEEENLRRSSMAGFWEHRNRVTKMEAYKRTDSYVYPRVHWVIWLEILKELELFKGTAYEERPLTIDQLNSRINSGMICENGIWYEEDTYDGKTSRRMVTDQEGRPH